MANVTVTDEMGDDSRFDHAGVLLGIDGDLVRFRMTRLWSWQTDKYTPEEPTYVVTRGNLVGRFGIGGPDALVEADLAEVRDGGYYIKGTVGKIEWLWKKKAAGGKGYAEKVRRSKSSGAQADLGQTSSSTGSAAQVVSSPHDPGSEIRNPEEIPETESRPAAPAVLALTSPKPDPAADLAAHATAEINRVSGRAFDPASKATRKLCKALVRDRRTSEDVTAVVERKAIEWLGTKLADRVCPGTLLAAENFGRYLDEIRAGPPTRASPNGRPVTGQVPISHAPRTDGEQIP